MECVLFVGDPHHAAIVTVTGEIDMTSAPEFRTAVRKGLYLRDHLVLDMTELEFIDSSGLSVIVEAARDLRGPVELRNAPAHLRRLIEIAQLDSIVTFV